MRERLPQFRLDHWNCISLMNVHYTIFMFIDAFIKMR